MVLPGSDIGKCAAFARRSGKQWFIGVINGGEATTLDFHAGFSRTRQISNDSTGRRAGSRRRLAAQEKAVNRGDPCICLASQRRLRHRTQSAKIGLRNSVLSCVGVALVGVSLVTERPRARYLLGGSLANARGLGSLGRATQCDMHSCRPAAELFLSAKRPMASQVAKSRSS